MIRIDVIKNVLSVRPHISRQMICKTVICILILIKYCNCNSEENKYFSIEEKDELHIYSLNTTPFINFDENCVPISGIEYNLLKIIMKKINKTSKYHMINSRNDLINIDHKYICPQLIKIKMCNLNLFL